MTRTHLVIDQPCEILKSGMNLTDSWDDLGRLPRVCDLTSRNIYSSGSLTLPVFWELIMPKTWTGGYICSCLWYPWVLFTGPVCVSASFLTTSACPQGSQTAAMKRLWQVGTENLGSTTEVVTSVMALPSSSLAPKRGSHTWFPIRPSKLVSDASWKVRCCTIFPALCT